MPPTQKDLRPLRPPPQPWVPPYHRAAIDRKMKRIRWAFFSFFVLLVLYPSARVLGFSPGGSVLGSSNDAFGPSPDGSVYHIDEVVRQKGNGVEILKPGGGGMVEGILGEGRRGLIARLYGKDLEGRQSKDKEHFKDHRAQVDRWIAYDGYWKDREILMSPNGTSYHGKKDYDEIIANQTQEFTKEIRSQCPFWEGCSKEDLESIEQKYRTRICRFVPLLQHGPLSSWHEIDKLIDNTTAFLESVVSKYQLEYETIEWNEMISDAISYTDIFIRRFCRTLDGCDKQEEEDKALRKLHTEYGKFTRSPDDGPLTKRVDSWWQNWSDFDKDIEDLVKYYQSIAPLWQMGVPGLGKKEWDEQTETLLRQTTEAIGKSCLRLPDCTEKDVENAVQKAETKLRSLKSLIQSRDVDQLAIRDISKDEWAEFDKQTEVFGKTMDDLARKLATLDPLNLPQLGRETFDQQAEDLISANAEHFREKCIGTRGCTEHDVLTMVQSMKDRIQKSSDLISSPALPLTGRDLSSEEWASVEGRIEAFGKSADNLAQKLAASGAPGARKAFDQTVDEWIRVINQGTQEQCVAVEGCNDHDLAAITQKMRDRASKFAAAIHSRDASTDAFDRSLVEFGTQMDTLVRQLNQIDLPRSKNLFDTIADEMFRVGEKISQNQCISMGGCDDQVLATRLQEMKDRAQQTAKSLHSREVSFSLLSRDLSKEKWALINQIIENWGQNMDTITQNPVQIGLPELTMKDFEAFIDEQLPSQLKELEDMCPITEGCNEQVLATIRQKFRDRTQKSASLLHSPDFPASAKRNFPVDQMAANDVCVDELQKTTSGKIRTESSINIFNWKINELSLFEKDFREECRKTVGCTNQDGDKEIKRVNEEIKTWKSTQDIHEEDNLEDNFFKEFTAEPLEFDGFNLETTTKIFRAAIPKTRELHAQKIDVHRIQEFLENVQLFETQATADAIIEHCKEPVNCGMGDLQSFVGLWEEESSTFLYSTIFYLLPDNDKRSNGPVEELSTEKSRLARGNYPVEFSTGMDQTMEMANRIFYAVLPIIREFRLDKEYAERALKYVAELATEDSLRSCMELSYCTQQDVTLFSEKFEKKVHEFLGSMDWQPAGKRSDGLLIPFLDLKGPPSLTEGSIPAEKRDSPRKTSEIMDDDIAAMRKILDAVFPVAQEFGTEQTKIVLRVEKMIIELCKEENEFTLQGDDLRTFQQRYHELLENFQNSAQSGEGHYAEELSQLETRDSAENVLEIMNGDIAAIRKVVDEKIDHELGDNKTNPQMLLWVEDYMLSTTADWTEHCRKHGMKHCLTEFTVSVQVGNDAVPPITHEFTNTNKTTILLWVEREMRKGTHRVCKVNGWCDIQLAIGVEGRHLLYIVQPFQQSDIHEHAAAVVLATEKTIEGAAHHCGPVKNCVIDWILEISTQILNRSEVAYRQGRVGIKMMVFEAESEMNKQITKRCERVEECTMIGSSVAIGGLVTQDAGVQSSKREDNLLEKSSQSSPKINHRADNTSTDMKDFQGFAEMDQGVDQGANQTAIEVDCNVDPTNEDCSPTPDSTSNPAPPTNETQGKNRLTAFTNWLPFIALFSIISLLLLLLVLKCCTAWSRTRRSVPDESGGPPTPTNATSQPLLGPATRPDDEEAQMTQIREPVAPTGLDGASEGWVRRWIPSKRGNELKVGKRSSPDPSSPHLLPKPPTRAPRIPPLQLPKAIFLTVRAASGLGSPVETDIQKRRVKWGSTL